MSTEETNKDTNTFLEHVEKFFRDPLGPVRSQISPNMLAIDLKDEGEFYKIEADLPGISKEDIRLRMKDDVLNITISQKDSEEEVKDDGKYIRRERFYSSSSRNIRLPLAIKDGDISASLANGVLEVTVPKTNVIPDASREIEIK